MTITHAGLCFLVATILFAIAFVLEWTPSANIAARVETLGWCLIALGLLLTQ